jgi:hypothetical protein
VLRSERPTTRLSGCETLFVVVELTAEQAEAENADTDVDAEG